MTPATRTRLALALALTLALGVVACDRPAVALLCHNSNCADPVDPDRDDTLAALAESLALEHDGRPAIDGVEVDLFWRGADATCIFAHDLQRAEAATAAEVAAALAAHLQRPGPVTFTGGPFELLVELKPHVGLREDEAHSPPQREQHAACAWQTYDTIAAAAIAADRDVLVTFSSFAPALLDAIERQRPAAPPVPARLAALQGIPAPLDGQAQPLDAYDGLPIAVVEVHPHWLLDGQVEAIAALGAELSLWMFSATTETFAAIRQHEPASVVTSEALLVRRWLAW